MKRFLHTVSNLEHEQDKTQQALKNNQEDEAVIMNKSQACGQVEHEVNNERYVSIIACCSGEVESTKTIKPAVVESERKVNSSKYLQIHYFKTVVQQNNYTNSINNAMQKFYRILRTDIQNICLQCKYQGVKIRWSGLMHLYLKATVEVN